MAHHEYAISFQIIFYGKLNMLSGDVGLGAVTGNHKRPDADGKRRRQIVFDSAKPGNKECW